MSLRVSPQDLFSTRKTLPHGHVEAIVLAIRKLGLDIMLSAKRCPDCKLVRFLTTLVSFPQKSGNQATASRLFSLFRFL